LNPSIKKVWTTFQSGKTRREDWRRVQLSQLKKLIKENEEDLFEALYQDLHKNRMDAYSTETGFLVNQIEEAENCLSDWIAKKRITLPLAFQPGRSFVLFEPLGVVLILGAWNFPIQLLLGPLVAAIAAGNCAVLKPSEIAPKTSSILERLIPEYLDQDCFAVVEGGSAVVEHLMTERFHKIFFTGSQEVGRKLARTASKQLIPITLELGGKSPCIVDRSANVEVAAKRIVQGRFSNTGQMCIAPDYLLVHSRQIKPLVNCLKETITLFYGKYPQRSPDYGRIVNRHHFNRLLKLLEEGRVISGGTL